MNLYMDFFMKKYIKILCVAISILLCTVSFSSCDAPINESTINNVSDPVAEITTSVSLSACEEIERYVFSEMTYSNRMKISDITVVPHDASISVMIRTVAVGGSYIPIVGEEAVPLILEKIDELNIGLESIDILEYMESNSEGKTNMIFWTSKDGAVGTFSNEKTNDFILDATIDELKMHFGIEESSTS